MYDVQYVFENFESRGDGKKRVGKAGGAGYVDKSKRAVAWEIAVVTATESRAWQLMWGKSARDDQWEWRGTYDDDDDDELCQCLKMSGTNGSGSVFVAGRML
jgi:hypothetical protein